MNKILLVDDDRELTSLLKELLEMEGFDVLVAHDGEQALELLDDSIDLLLLDVIMPKKNGIDTPVSYTHLDVYKRQFLIWSNVPPLEKCSFCAFVQPPNSSSMVNSFSFGNAFSYFFATSASRGR